MKFRQEQFHYPSYFFYLSQEERSLQKRKMEVQEMKQPFHTSIGTCQRDYILCTASSEF